MTKNNKKSTAQPTVVAEQKPVTLDSFRLNWYHQGNQTTKTNQKISGGGEWLLCTYGVPMGEKYGVNSLEEFVEKFCGEHIRNPMQTFGEWDLMEMIENLPIELENIDKPNMPVKSFDGLPKKFEKCIQVCLTGNSKCYACLSNRFFYFFYYGTS